MTSPHFSSPSSSGSTGSGRIPRRTALQWLGGALAVPALSAGRRAVAAPGASIWKTAIGLNGFQSSSHKYGKNYPIWEILDFAAREGFAGVELVSNWPAGGYPAAAEKGRIRALRRLYDQYGLRIFSIQLGAEGAFAPEAEGRAEWLKEFRDRAELARQLGCACVGLWPGGGLRGQSIDEAIARLAGSFREAGKVAGDLGLLACFEIEPPFVFNTEDHYRRILHGAEHPSLKGIYDPSHFDLMTGSTGKPEAMLERIGVQHIGYAHFCDTDGTLRDGGTSKHVPCGGGHTDCARGLRVLKAGGFRGWIMVDAWEIPDPYDACVRCKKVIDEVGRSENF